MVVLVFDWRDSAELVEDPPMVEPVDPFEGGELEIVEASPWPPVADQFGLVETDDRLGERVVVGVASLSDRRRHTGFGESFCVTDREVLSSTIRMMNQTVEGFISPVAFPDGLFQRVERQVRLQRP